MGETTDYPRSSQIERLIRNKKLRSQTVRGGELSCREKLSSEKRKLLHLDFQEISPSLAPQDSAAPLTRPTG